MGGTSVKGLVGIRHSHMSSDHMNADGRPRGGNNGRRRGYPNTGKGVEKKSIIFSYIFRAFLKVGR